MFHRIARAWAAMNYRLGVRAWWGQAEITATPRLDLGNQTFHQMSITGPFNVIFLEPSLFTTTMSTPPYSKRVDNSQSPPGECSSTKKRRKGAARLSCAECRRQVPLKLWCPNYNSDHTPGWSWGAIATFHVAAARNAAVVLFVLTVSGFSFAFDNSR